MNIPDEKFEQWSESAERGDYGGSRGLSCAARSIPLMLCMMTSAATRMDIRNLRSITTPTASSGQLRIAGMESDYIRADGTMTTTDVPCPAGLCGLLRKSVA